MDDETVLTAFDPATAEEMQAQRIPGQVQIRVVSPQGDAVALMAPRTTTVSTYPRPGTRPTSTSPVPTAPPGAATSSRATTNRRLSR